MNTLFQLISFYNSNIDRKNSGLCVYFALSLFVIDFPHKDVCYLLHTGQFAYMQFVKPIDLRWEYACANTQIHYNFTFSTEYYRFI